MCQYQVFDQEQTEAYALIATLQALKLEIRGLRRRGPSVFSIVKKKYQLKGNKNSILVQFSAIVRQRLDELYPKKIE